MFSLLTFLISDRAQGPPHDRIDATVGRETPAAATASLARPSAAIRPSRVSRSTSPTAALVRPRPRPPPATSRAAAAAAAAATIDAKAARSVAARTLNRSAIDTSSTSRPTKSLARRPRSSSDPAIHGHAPHRPVGKSPRSRRVKAAARLTRLLGTSRPGTSHQRKTPPSQRRPLPRMFWLELELEPRPRFKKRATMTRQSTRS